MRRAEQETSCRCTCVPIPAVTIGGRLPDTASEVEFFGIRLRVSNARLATLLNSDVTDDVVVIADRALSLRTKTGDRGRGKGKDSWFGSRAGR